MSPDRTVTMQTNIPEIGPPAEPLATAFVHCSTEAQMLEHAIKNAITKDVMVFAKVDVQVSFLDVLEKVTLGQAKDIAMGSSSRKGIAACVGFFDFVKMQWTFTGRPESDLRLVFKDAVSRRNRLAHRLLVDILHSAVSIDDALSFLKESSERFFGIRCLIVAADELSSKIGSVASDGSSLPRFKTTS